MTCKDLCLVLNFRDAKTFNRNPFKDSHRMVEASGLNKRCARADSWIDIPVDTLSVQHVSNVLHVLAGERPVPSIRQASVPGSPSIVSSIYELAAESLVKVTEGLFTDKEGVPQVYREEALMTRKGSKDSVMPVGMDKFLLSNSSWDTRARLLVWDRAKYSMGLSVFEKFVGMSESVLGISGIMGAQSLISTIKALRDSGHADVKSFLASNKVKQPWANLIVEGEADLSGLKSGYTDANYFMAYTVARGKESISVRSGTIYVPVSEGDLGLFRKGPGWSTLLEGGLVYIQGVKDFSRILVQGAKPVFQKESV